MAMVDGDSGNNLLETTLGNDTVSAGDGNDVIFGGSGTDVVDGGPGRDTLSFWIDNSFYFKEVQGKRQIVLANTNISDQFGDVDTDISGVEMFEFIGVFVSPALPPAFDLDASQLTGSASVFSHVNPNSTVIGSPQDDIFTVNGGASSLSGGGGFDSANVPLGSEDPEMVEISADASGRLEIASNQGLLITIRDVENIFLSGSKKAASTVNWSTINQAIVWSGRLADATVTAGSGNDSFYFGSGHEAITGGAGADTYYVAASLPAGPGAEMSGDTIIDFAGNDRISFISSNISFIGRSAFTGVARQVRYETGGGQTRIQIDGNGDAVADATLTLSNGEFTVLETTAGTLQRMASSTSAADTIVGGVDDDVINGEGGNDTLTGSGGNDRLDGGPGNDTLTGGPGNDLFVLGARGFGSDTITDFTRGQDRIDVSAIGITDMETLSKFFSANLPDGRIDLFYGGVFEGVTLKGVATSLSSLSASDFFFSTATGDQIVTGTGQLDYLFGANGDDMIDGGAGSDKLFGAQGEDRLKGGRGADTLTGGAGMDTFVYDSVEFDNDTIADFSLLEDRIDVSAWGVGDLTTIKAIFNTSSDGSPVSDTLIFLRYNDSPHFITISGVNPDLLTSDNFVFSTDRSDREIVGTNVRDYLFGGLGNDRITGNLDADFVIGGAGVDTGVLLNPRSSYTITQSDTKPGLFQVSGTGPGIDGNDNYYLVEYLQFSDETVRLFPGTGTTVNFETDSPATYMAAIRDFDGNDLGSASGWTRIGQADANGDGDIDQFFVNQANGRFAEVATGPDGKVFFADHGWAGETRVVGIYVDPLVQSGEVVAGGPFDSQRRFQNDLTIGNIDGVLGADDYDKDGLQEVYFSLTDGTAYLHAYMHADGNIRYANYQSQQEVIDFLTSNGWAASTYAGWFG